jgi:hypothetical protein
MFTNLRMPCITYRAGRVKAQDRLCNSCEIPKILVSNIHSMTWLSDTFSLHSRPSPQYFWRKKWITGNCNSSIGVPYGFCVMCWGHLLFLFPVSDLKLYPKNSKHCSTDNTSPFKLGLTTFDHCSSQNIVNIWSHPTTLVARSSSLCLDTLCKQHNIC